MIILMVKSTWFVIFFSFAFLSVKKFAWRTWDLVQLNESIEGWVSDGRDSWNSKVVLS